jgi:hypothetical protein
VSRREGRVWLFAPTNQFGGYRLPFLKGTVEPGYTSLPAIFWASGSAARRRRWAGRRKRSGWCP